MLMRAGLSSNAASSVLMIGLVQMLLAFGAENSRRVFSAMASETVIELPPDWFDFDWEVDASLFFLLFLIRDSGSSMKFFGRLKPVTHYPV